MSAPVEVPALIAGSVPTIGLARALAQAGLVIRHDSARNVIVIEPAPDRPSHRYEFDGSTARP